MKKNDLPSGWRVVELGDVTKLTNVKFDLKDLVLNKYISTENMLKNLGGIERARKIPLTGKVKNFQEGDVLFSNIRTYFRKVWYATLDGSCSNDVSVFRSTKGIYSRYMYYLLADNTFIDYTDKTSKGTKMPRGDKDAILKYPAYIPPLSEQKAIAHILGKLDDKIALNRQINQTLETMAQTLFKSWFVNFDPVIDNALKAGNPIPNSLKTQSTKRKTTQSTLPKTTQNLFPNRFVFNDKLKKWIPEGWTSGSILNLCVKIQNGGTPRRDDKKYWENGNIPWLTSGEVKQNIVCKTNNYITDLGFKNSSVKLIPKLSTVIAMYGATAGQVAIVAIETTTNQAICSLVAKQNCEYFNYLTFLNQVKILHRQARGSAQQNISKGIIEDMGIIISNIEIINHFNNLAKDYFKENIFNLKQIETLTKLRDTLLPKLISGKIQVKIK